MSKSKRMDVESSVLHAGLRLLSQVEPVGRRRVLSYWCARSESLPLINARGEVLEEHPIEDEPPMIKFINSARHEPETAAQPDA